MRPADSVALAPVLRERQHPQDEADAHPPLLSLLIPVYNERLRIVSTLETAINYLERSEIDYELIVVSDGSTDGTNDLVSQFATTHPRVRLLAYHPNRGKGYAVRTGMAAARGAYVMFIDADLTVPITIVGQFLDALQDGYDIVVASRRHPESSIVAPPPWKRRMMSNVFAWLVRRLLVDEFPDTQCGGKAYRADVARRLFARQRIDHFSFDAGVIFLALREGYRIKEVPVTLRYVPTSSIRPVRDSLLMLRDLLRIRVNAWRGVYDHDPSG